MPIPSQNATTITVNAVLVPQIVVSTRIDPTTGKLVTSARAVLQGAQCSNGGQPNESWQAAAGGGTMFIPDVSNLAGIAATADLAPLQAQVGEAFMAMAELIAAINAIRKVV